MIQRKLTKYIKEETRIDKEVLKKLKKIADRYTLQYALLWYVYLKRSAGLRELYRIYRYLSNKVVRENTVRKQLRQLERKGLLKRIRDRYVALVDPREVTDLFDVERSKAGKVGATLRHLRIKQKGLKISPGLAYYTKQVVETAQKLVRKGKRAAALDLLVHTLLPIRENGILWAWHNDIFIYYEPKIKQFRAVKSEEVAKLLRKLGFSEGIMIMHVLGHKESSKIIHKLFQRGPYSWPWARSVSYGLKQLGLLREVENLLKIQLKKISDKVELILWNLYSRELVTQHSISWRYEVPEPLRNKSYVVATVLGKQHIKREIEEDSYFSKWRE